MDDADLIARVCDSVAGYLALGNELIPADGATFVRNLSTPRRRDSNHVGLIRASQPASIEAVLSKAEAVFVSIPYRRFDIDALTPPQFVARLVLDGGFKEPGDGGLYLVLEGQLLARVRDDAIEIREALSDDDWAAYRGLDEMWWRETSIEYLGPYDASLHNEFMASKRAKAPAARSWLACVDGVPCSFLTSWPGENGVGQVEDLYTHPQYRHRGIATALLAHCVADARARGAGPVAIIADPKGTPKQMYAAMGFRPLFIGRSYLKVLV